MRDETKMDVYTSGVTGAEYDAGMKQLMSNKEIIVPILQMTVPEFSRTQGKFPAGVTKSNKQWVGTCLYQEECKLLLINWRSSYSVMSK